MTGEIQCIIMKEMHRWKNPNFAYKMMAFYLTITSQE